MPHRTKKRHAKGNQNHAKKVKRRNEDKVADEEVEDADKNVPKMLKKGVQKEDIQKMFASTIDPFDAPLKWWETEHVKYAINYPPVKLRLEKVMGTHIVRLTDRNYMTKLAFNILRDHEEEQINRIEGRKLSPPSIISRLMQISYRALYEKIQRQERNKIKLPN